MWQVCVCVFLNSSQVYIYRILKTFGAASGPWVCQVLGYPIIFHCLARSCAGEPNQSSESGHTNCVRGPWSWAALPLSEFERLGRCAIAGCILTHMKIWPENLYWVSYGHILMQLLKCIWEFLAEFCFQAARQGWYCQKAKTQQQPTKYAGFDFGGHSQPWSLGTARDVKRERNTGLHHFYSAGLIANVFKTTLLLHEDLLSLPAIYFAAALTSMPLKVVPGDTRAIFINYLLLLGDFSCLVAVRDGLLCTAMVAS